VSAARRGVVPSVWRRSIYRSPPHRRNARHRLPGAGRHGSTAVGQESRLPSVGAPSDFSRLERYGTASGAGRHGSTAVGQESRLPSCGAPSDFPSIEH